MGISIAIAEHAAQRPVAGSGGRWNGLHNGAKVGAIGRLLDRGGRLDTVNNLEHKERPTIAVTGVAAARWPCYSCMIAVEACGHL